MNALTIEAIETVGGQVHPDFVYHVTSIAYVQTLLRPYAEAIDQATTIDGIRDWIPQAFPGELAKHAAGELDKAVGDGLEAVKVAVIEYIVTEILELAGNVARDNEDNTVLPWDVQKAIGSDEELLTVTGITNDLQILQNGWPGLLPVVINGYTHYLSQDFVAGLLLFSVRYGQDFRVMMFGVPFTSFYMTQVNRYTAGRLTLYKVTIIDTDFDFDSPDFMQGFATGALWANVDHHNYWTALYQTAEDGDEVAITF